MIFQILCTLIFFNHILEPTRVVLNSKPALIDNVYISTYDKTIHSSNFLNKLTDHMPSFCIIKDTYKLKQKNKKNKDLGYATISKRQISQISFNKSKI